MAKQIELVFGREAPSPLHRVGRKFEYIRNEKVLSQVPCTFVPNSEIGRFFRHGMSIVASIVNLVRLMTVATLSH